MEKYQDLKVNTPSVVIDVKIKPIKKPTKKPADIAANEIIDDI